MPDQAKHIDRVCPPIQSRVHGLIYGHPLRTRGKIIVLCNLQEMSRLLKAESLVHPAIPFLPHGKRQAAPLLQFYRPDRRLSLSLEGIWALDFRGLENAAFSQTVFLPSWICDSRSALPPYMQSSWKRGMPVCRSARLHNSAPFSENIGFCKSRCS